MECLNSQQTSLGNLKWDLGICTSAGCTGSQCFKPGKFLLQMGKCGERITGFCDFVVIAIKGHGTSLLNPLAHSTVPETTGLRFRTNFYFMNVTMFWWESRFLEFQ